MTTLQEKWKQCEKSGNHMRRTLQKHERSNTTLEKQHANCKQEQDHNAKPTTEKHNREQKNTNRQKENCEMKQSLKFVSIQNLNLKQHICLPRQ